MLDLAQGGKPGALNAGDAVVQGDRRAYLDADVIVSPAVMAELVRALEAEAPRYAGASPRIPRARSAVTRAYARFWQRLPFAQSVAPGYGLFAVNTAGRTRWGDFPAIISDDTFVRLQFTPAERVQVPAPYDWPMIEGLAALTRVRRRQDAGVAEIDRLYPGLLAREGKPRLTKPALIVAPTSLMGNWRSELQRFAPGLSTLILHGSTRSERFEDVARSDVVVTTYPLLSRDQEMLVAQAWSVVVLATSPAGFAGS